MCGYRRARLIQVSTIDKMASAYTLKYAQKGGKQLQEAFEEEPQDTLSASFGAAPAEQAGSRPRSQ